MQTYLTRSSSLHRVLLLIDLTTGVLASDRMLLDLLVEQTQTVTLCLTKADKVKPAQIQTTAMQSVESL